MKSPRFALLATLLPLLAATPASLAADSPKPPDHPADHAPDRQPADHTSPDKRLALLPPDSITHHSTAWHGQTLDYTATAGTMPLRDQKGDQIASIFYVAYTLNHAQGATPRPVTFFFNGGPGAGSAYLHLGAAGPRVLNFPAGNEADGTHATLRENPETWLGFTDMVFIDPVGTGYSLAAKPEDAPKLFWGVHQDAEALAKTIDLWLVRNGRTASPKFLAGESYGGIRSVKVARALQHDQGVLLNGIIMVSPLLEQQYFFSDDPMTYAFLLPTLAAAAAGRDGKLTPQLADNAYTYALGPYLSTIAGPMLQGQAATDFFTRVADLTGLPESVVAKQRGMLQADSHDVRSLNGRLYSLYDMTLSIADPAPEGVDNDESPDPLLDGYGRAYGEAFAGYAADDLGFKTDLTYRLLDDEVNAHWDWHEAGRQVLSTNMDLRKLLALNPSLHVLIVHGYFDTVCPFAATRWLTAHLPVGQDRVALRVYPGGHMLYTRPTSRTALAHDAAEMINSAAAASP
jgi:carboxypeptidase C (cathepsin A)